ncbi:MAG: HAMP domain-containing histidine kinase, partial [Proteobacteria bacterium]
MARTLLRPKLGLRGKKLDERKKLTARASEVLAKKSKLIMQRFEERARREVSSAFGTTSLTLQDSLPKHLSQLVAALASADRLTIEEIAKRTVAKENIGKEHGKDRSSSGGYSMGELIFEYQILRQTVVLTLQEEISLTSTEYEIITDLLEQAVNDAAVEFSKIQKTKSEEFTATLSHDLRTPMAAAKLSAEMIVRDTNSGEAARRNAQRILDGIKRMDSMVKDLLDAGRLEAGMPLPEKICECRPAAIAEEAVELMTTIHGPRFTIIADKKIQARWNADLYRRALENLLSNAVKYGDATGQITLSITTEGAQVRTTVHNLGNPIP